MFSRRIVFILKPALLFIILLSFACSSTPNEGFFYDKTVLFGSSSDETVWDMDLDTQGNIFIGGLTSGDLNGEINPATLGGFVAKFDSNGLIDWARIINSSNLNMVNAVKTDTYGNVIVGGYVTSKLDLSCESYCDDYNGSNDIFIMKFSPDGTILWIRQFGTSADEYVADIGIDREGNILAAASSKGDLDGDGSGTHSGDSDIALLSLTTDGVLNWIVQTGTSDFETPRSIALDRSGKIYIAGEAYGDLDGLTNNGSMDIFIKKYDPESKVWLESVLFGTEGHDLCAGLTVSENNIYITGNVSVAFGGNLALGKADIILLKYDLNLKNIWSKQLGTAENDASKAIASDTRGNVYITGSTYGEFEGKKYYGESDAFVLWIDKDGTVRQTEQIGTEGSDIGKGIAVDINAKVFVAGDTDGELNGEINTGGQDLFLLL